MSSMLQMLLGWTLPRLHLWVVASIIVSQFTTPATADWAQLPDHSLIYGRVGKITSSGFTIWRNCKSDPVYIPWRFGTGFKRTPECSEQLDLTAGDGQGGPECHDRAWSVAFSQSYWVYASGIKVTGSEIEIRMMTRRTVLVGPVSGIYAMDLEDEACVEEVSGTWPSSFKSYPY